jgi:hypothetical protein
MANQYWGAPAIAEYSRMSLQEMAWGPQQLAARDKAAEDSLNTMNEANLSLQGVLGKSAGKQEEFTSKYQEALGKINTEGANKRNLELVREARNLYLTHVVPMQDFAKKREAMAGEYAKARMDGDNILTGDSPLAKSFDEYLSDPNSLNSFQVVSRDKLNGLGRAYGENYAKGITGRDTTDIDLGIMNFVKGFKNSQDAYAAYQNDPKFKSLVEAQINQVAKARGLDPSHQEVRDAISGGIMSGVVGGMERAPVSAAVMKGLQDDGNQGRTRTDFLSIVDDPNLNISEGDDLLELAKEDPEMNSQLDELAKQLTNGDYTLAQMEAKINSSGQGWRKYAPDLMDKSGIADPEGLRMKREEIKKMLKGHPYFSRTQRISLDKGAIADLGKTASEDVLYRVQQKLDTPIKNALLSGALIDNAYSSDDKDLLEKIFKQEVAVEGKDFAEVVSMGYQGMAQPIVKDNKLVDRKVSGPGKPVLSISIRYKDPGTKDFLTRVINIKPTGPLYNAAKEVVGIMYNQNTSSDRDLMTVRNMEALDKKYFSSKINQGVK